MCIQAVVKLKIQLRNMINLNYTQNMTLHMFCARVVVSGYNCMI